MELDDKDEVELPVLYERLLYFYFCYGIIGYQLKECSTYNGQPKGKLPYGVYMKALSKAEKTKLNRGKNRGNRRFEQPLSGFRVVEHHRRSQPQ